MAYDYGMLMPIETHRHVVGASEVANDTIRVANAHVTDERKEPSARGEKVTKEQINE